MNQDNIKKVVQDQFGRNATKYVSSESHAKGDDLDLIIQWLEPKLNWRVLDIATGGGHVAKKLSAHCAHVFATDLTKSMLEAAAHHLQQSHCNNISYIVADAESLPFLDQSFDAITCRIAAHHFPNPKQFVHEVARVLKADGKFVFIDNVAPKQEPLAVYMNTVEQLRDESHVRCPSITEWKSWFGAVGLEEEYEQERKKTFHFPSWVERTAKSQEQMQHVESFIINADTSMHEYFSVRLEKDRVVSFEIDEWRVVYRKKNVSCKNR